MNEITIINDTISNKIYTIRGLQVMLDRDLAELYGVKPIRLREQVKRNIERFPIDFMFQLSENEVNLMVSQNAIPSKQHLGGSLPFVFTEQGVATLSSVLTSKIAVDIHINIMRAFVNMRKFISNNALVFQRLDLLEQKQFQTDTKIEQILNALEDKTTKPKQGIFYDGQIYDAYVFVNDLLKNTKSDIVLIDNYIDDTVFTLLSKYQNLNIKIYTQTITKQLHLDYQKYKSQYQNIELVEFKKSHDRFLILDNKEIYHIGASLKDLGKKWFAFSKFEIGSLEILQRLE
ncbi:MAG: ORF6N domain-containing protein [Arcobacteraceae bacterium]|jgi:hypothetical protein|nr:ORF6N domain-containing protein [Arcobacteraceae bacterium]